MTADLVPLNGNRSLLRRPFVCGPRNCSLFRSSRPDSGDIIVKDASSVGTREGRVSLLRSWSGGIGERGGRVDFADRTLRNIAMMAPSKNMLIFIPINFRILGLLFFVFFFRYIFLFYLFILTFCRGIINPMDR